MKTITALLLTTLLTGCQAYDPDGKYSMDYVTYYHKLYRGDFDPPPVRKPVARAYANPFDEFDEPAPRRAYLPVEYDPDPFDEPSIAGEYYDRPIVPGRPSWGREFTVPGGTCTERPYLIGVPSLGRTTSCY